MINIDKKPTDYGSLFYGDYGGIGRLDIAADSDFKELAEIDEANFWGLNIVSCSSDRWRDMAPNQLSKAHKTLAYQTLMDGTVPDLFFPLADLATDPWLSYLYSRIGTMEKVHTNSYSSGVSQAFGAEAEEFLDIIYTDDIIKGRVEPELEIAARFIKAYKQDFLETTENKKLLLEVLIKIFILEGVKFPFSFFTTWTMNKASGNCIQGFSQLLIKISIDEMVVHTTTGATVINKLRLDTRFKDLFDSGWFKDMANRAFDEALTNELGWVDYLLEDGEVQGFTYDICEHFINYWINTRKRQIRIKPDTVGYTKNDIIDWYNKYRNPNQKVNASQEQDNIAYKKNTVLNDLDKFDLGKDNECKVQDK